MFSRLLLGPAIVGLALSRLPWLSMALMAVIGYSFITQLVLTNTLIQMIVPDELRGYHVVGSDTWRHDAGDSRMIGMAPKPTSGSDSFLSTDNISTTPILGDRLWLFATSTIFSLTGSSCLISVSVNL